jgi:DNA polymerase III alpha subunit (gram-positive type)
MIDENEIYVVVDIETDGPIPGMNSMLSLAAVATTAKKEVDTFYRKLEPLESAEQDQKTMDWWKTEPEAWQEATSDAKPAKDVIIELCDWLDKLGKNPIFVAHPISFDYPIVRWYLSKFAAKNPFATTGAWTALDLSSFIAGKYNLSLNNSRRPNLPETLKVGMPDHTHNALDDARGFGVILRNALKN